MMYTCQLFKIRIFIVEIVLPLYCECDNPYLESTSEFSLLPALSLGLLQALIFEQKSIIVFHSSSYYREVLKTRSACPQFFFKIWGGVRGGALAPPRIAGGGSGGAQPPPDNVLLTTLLMRIPRRNSFRNLLETY